MHALGLDLDGLLIAEGNEYRSRSLWPQPFVSLATILRDPTDLLRIPAKESLDTAPLLFREDTFDPVTRIRRGRLYRNSGGTQPKNWKNIMGHPDLSASSGVYLCTYQPAQWSSACGDMKFSGVRISLGTTTAYSLWDVVMVEHITGQSDLITLRARSTLGLLPSADDLSIPAELKPRVQQTIDAAADASHRLLADSMVDACRHAASASLGAWIHPALGDQALQKDLGPLLEMIEKLFALEKPVVILSVGRLLARLHSRTKPNEQALRGVRKNEDSDGEAATSMLGLLLRELRAPPALPPRLVAN